MNSQLERLTLLDVSAGLECCRNRKEEYKQKLLEYLENEVWGDVQAYFEIGDWEKYRETAAELERSSRSIGALALAEMAAMLAVAAREENNYYIEKNQPEAMKLYRDTLDQIAQVFLRQETGQQELLPETGGHVLVIDDSEECLKEAEAILSGHFSVSLAKSWEETLKILNKKRIELILLDIHMPGTGGIEIMGLLQKEERFQKIPVIFLTTDLDRNTEVRGFKAGGQDFITKPYIEDVMLQRISRILELSRLQNDLQREVEKQTKQAEDRLRQVERLSDQIIHALAETIDAKDTYTNGHSLRVAQYSLEIAKRAGKNETEQERIYYMGMLHDIGKIGIPDSIITKNSGLSDKEYFVTRKHPEIGAEILATISEIPGLDVGAHWHHERYDGTGYPDGLKGSGIPEEARIIAVADAYDAMASKRSYRDVLPQQVVYEEIKKGKGTQFDPVYADIMLQMMDADKEYNMRER